MSLFGSRSTVPAPRPSSTPAPISKPTPKPAPEPVKKPGLFEGSRQVSVRELFHQVKASAVIPGTGGKEIYKREHKDLLKKYLPYKQVGTYLKPEEAKNILRKMRHEDKGAASRDRRLLEQEWGLKGKY